MVININSIINKFVILFFHISNWFLTKQTSVWVRFILIDSEAQGWPVTEALESILHSSCPFSVHLDPPPSTLMVHERFPSCEVVHQRKKVEKYWTRLANWPGVENWSDLLQGLRYIKPDVGDRVVGHGDDGRQHQSDRDLRAAGRCKKLLTQKDMNTHR